jgi:hypothetical protein
VSEDKDDGAEMVTVVCYASVADAFTKRSRWRVRGKEPRSKGKVVLLLERVKR